MSGKQKEDFFNDLDKTADMLRTFKPSVEQPKDINFDEIEKLYNALEESEEQERLENKKIILERTAEMEKLEKVINARLAKEKEAQENVKEEEKVEKSSSITPKESEKKEQIVEEKKEDRKVTSTEKVSSPKVKRELTR